MITRRAGVGLAAAALLGGGAHAAEADEVRIGAAVSLTGQLSREGTLLRNGYAYWQDVANAQGGINVGGRRLPAKIFFYDDESNAQTSARLTERCITEDHVIAMFGPYSSGIATATASISERYKIPTIAPHATADSLYTRGYKFIFTNQPLASVTLDPMIDLMKALPTPPRTIAIAGPDDLFPNVFAAAARSKAEASGLQVVYAEKYPKASVDLSSVATAVKQAAPDTLILTGYVQDTVLMVKTLQSLKVDPKMIGCSTAIGVPDVLNALGTASQDLMGVLYWDAQFSYTGAVIPSSPSFHDGYVKQFNAEPNFIPAAGAGAGVILQQAIGDAGSLNPVQIRDAIAKLDITTFYSRVKFNDRGANILASSAVAQVRDGRPLLVWPKDLQVAPVQYPRHPFV